MNYSEGWKVFCKKILFSEKSKHLKVFCSPKVNYFEESKVFFKQLLPIPHQ